MRNRATFTMLAALAAASTLGLSAASAQTDQSQCFMSNDWSGGWKATPDDRTIFIRVGVDKIWRLDLGRACLALEAPNARLITDERGSSAICTANDLDLKVAAINSPAVGCNVSHIEQLSPDQASALPRNLRP